MAADTGVDFVAGDTIAAIELTFEDKKTGAALNLTGGSVALFWRVRASADNLPGPRQTAAMTLASDPTTGKCSYVWLANDLDAPETVTDEAGHYFVEVEAVFTNSAGKEITSLKPLPLQIRARFSA